jgi:ADP-L-glycero-D-manno-heptose 6-epimerase
MPSHWWGLKFFNVYGEHEQHKGRMASVVFNAFHQINKDKKINLFQSHNEKYGDGEQLRDFIYVADVVAICIYIFEQKIKNGIYNVGTGNARSFNDLAKAVFAALALPTAINYIPTPADIRDKYQYFTEANMQKLIATGYSFPFTSLEDGIKKYVSFLSKNTH